MLDIYLKERVKRDTRKFKDELEKAEAELEKWKS